MVLQIYTYPYKYKHWDEWFEALVPLHGLVRNGRTWLLDGVVLLGLSVAPVGRGVGEDGVRHGVRRVTLHAVQDVTDRQLGLQEEVQLAVRQTHRHVHHTAGEKKGSGIKTVHLV